MPNPTPKLTAEERARSCVVDGYKSHHPMSMDAVIHELGEATRKAFEEAAETADNEPMPSSPVPPEFKAYFTFEIIRATIKATRESIAGKIRALAKEQADGQQ